MVRVSPQELLGFAEHITDQSLETLKRRTPFIVTVQRGRILYVPTSTGTPRIHSSKALVAICEKFSKTNSFKVSDYKGLSAHVSYTLALISKYLNSCQSGGRIPSRVEDITDAGRLIRKIQSVLTLDLLKKEYRAGNIRNPMYGHCYAATEALYHFLRTSTKYSDFKPHRGKDEHGITHWWLQDPYGNILDPTKEQYLSVGRKPPYANGKGGPFLTQQPSARAKKILDRVRQIRKE